MTYGFLELFAIAYVLVLLKFTERKKCPKSIDITSQKVVNVAEK